MSLVVPTEASLVAMEMIPGREKLPIDAYAGVEMPDTTAAGLVLDQRTTQSVRRRPFAAAVDDQDLMDGLTCYARLLILPDGQRASLQIATSSQPRAEGFAPHVQRVALMIEALTGRHGR